MRSTTMKLGLGLGQLLRQHLLLATVILAYCALGYWLGLSHEVTVADEKVAALIKNFAFKIPQMIFLVLFWRLLHLTYVARVEDRFGVLKSEVRGFLTDKDRLLGGALAVALMTPMLITFAQIKNLLPSLNPFNWDVFFMQADKILHFGVLPHEYVHALFGGDYALSFFTGIYNIWLFMMYFTLLISCFLHPDSRTRMQYLLAFVLTWSIGGNLLATIFSSAGPTYYADLGLGSVYDGLMARLDAHAATGALSVVETQNLLWRFYSMPQSVNAISAFPSMHVASTVLMALLAFRMSRRAGLALSVFALGIMIGSVLLGWHYAVDGYVSAVLAMLCWFAAGWIIRSPIGPFPDGPSRA